MARNIVSHMTQAKSRDPRVHHSASGKDVVVPIVLWREPPQVEISALHVLELPTSQPSQNSSISFFEDEDNKSCCTQLCVFAGTKDGHVIYWRFDEDSVAQVNILVFPTSSGYPVVGIISGIDEWGQSTVFSATKDGALVKWLLPNGACAEANATIAKALAPLSGLEMLGNKRFAVVVSELSRLMVFDSWKMELLYCMNTAQEQIRRCVAVGELWRPHTEALRPKLKRSSSGSTIDSASMLLNAENLNDQSIPLSSRKSIPNRASDARRMAMLLSPIRATQQSSPQWDAVVISLGVEGLIKCFLWTQPRGTSGRTMFSFMDSGGADGSSRWVQRTSWVISWADQAQDITCSQSTSMNDGDNMNPQTALMGSIKSSYFPLSVKISSDSSRVLFIWKTKFVVIKRKWLCPLETQSDRQRKSKSFGTPRAKFVAGSCNLAPFEFVRQAATLSGNKGLSSNYIGSKCDTVFWENGMFLEDGTVMMWTNSKHVFQFPAAKVSDNAAGELFIFTKNQDQLVPRSDSKALRMIDKAVYVTRMDGCKCCDCNADNIKGARRKTIKSLLLLKERQRHPGFTSCISTHSLTASKLTIYHVCHNGTIGIRTTAAGRVSPPTSDLPTSSNTFSKILTTQVLTFQPVRFFSLTNGFESALSDVRGEHTKGTQEQSQHQDCLAHIILGRDDARSSSTYEVGRQARRRRNRQQPLNKQADERISSPGIGPSFTSTAAAVMANNVSVLANVLAPITVRSAVQDRREKNLGFDLSADQADDLMFRDLLDIPVIAQGYADGMLCIGLLSQEFSAKTGTNSEIKFGLRSTCHSGRITTLAHCFWRLETTSTSYPSPMSPSRVSMDKMCFATRHNRFYRSRFTNVSLEQNIGDRHRNDSRENHNRPSFSKFDTSISSDPDIAHNHGGSCPFQPYVKIFVFSGGTDGVFQVLDLRLFRSNEAASEIRHEVNIVHRFRNHRGAVQQISISPLKTSNNGPNSDREYPDRWVATVGFDHKVVLYGPQYLEHPENKEASSCDFVWWDCVFEFANHADRICNLEWQLERGLLCVECDDRMVYVWSLDTGILERIVPCALLYGDGNLSCESSSTVSSPLVDSKLFIGKTAVHLIEFAALRSANRLKKNWTSYYASLLQGDSTTNLTLEELPSLYATGSMELWMVSLLLSWGVSPSIDQMCQAILGIQPICALYSCALYDAMSGALTIPLPWTTPLTPELKQSEAQEKKNVFARHWQHSSALSATSALGVVSFCMSCMEYKHSRSGNGSTSPANKEEFQILWSQLITQHSIVIPESVAQFREPALEELAAFGFDPCEYTQLAARTLLSGVIKRLSATEKSSLSAEYSAKLHWEKVRLETETGSSFLGTDGSLSTAGATSSSQLSGTSTTSGSGTAQTDFKLSLSLVVEHLGSLVLIMGMIGTYFPAEISPASAREVCDVLVFLLKSPERFVASVSAELLTKGLMLFRPHLVDLSSLIVQLLLIVMREKQIAQIDEKGQDLSSPGGPLADFNECGTHAAMSLLVEVGAYESAFVLGLLQQEVHNYDRPTGFHESILLYMMELINTHYLLLCRHLSAFVDTIMGCLEPTKPERRRRCLPLSTRCLHTLVRRFPMVDFHQETQRLALGTMEAVIVIYDLRTATKWRVLDGHGSAVSAVRFRFDGQVLVSYAARDGSVRWWNSGNAGLFGGMLKMYQSCLKEHKLSTLQENSTGGASSSTGGTSAGLKQIIQTCRFQFLTRKDSSENKCTSNSERPKHVLRLTREDASQVQFLL